MFLEFKDKAFNAAMVSQVNDVVKRLHLQQSVALFLVSDAQQEQLVCTALLQFAPVAGQYALVLKDCLFLPNSTHLSMSAISNRQQGYVMSDTAPSQRFMTLLQLGALSVILKPAIVSSLHGLLSLDRHNSRLLD